MIESIFAGLNVHCLSKCDPAKSGQRYAAFLAPSEVVRAAKAFLAAEYFLEDVTAIDAKDGYCVVYHYDHFDRPGRVTLRCIIPHDNPKIPSIASVFQGAEWHERETTDFYGIDFVGNPNPVPLLVPDDLDVKPLRKEPAARAWLANIIEKGEVLRCEPGFTALDAKEEEAAKKAPAKAAAETEA